MADIFIPSISNSSIDSAQQIERIMEAERAPVVRMEEQGEALREESSLWNEVRRAANDLLEASQSLFQFNNSFSSREALSNNPDALTARARKNTPLGKFQISVQQIATTERLTSRSLPRSVEVSAGNYGFSLGTKEVNVQFPGGSLEEFANAITLQAKDSLQASIIHTTSSESVFMLFGELTGRENRIGFSDDARSLAANWQMISTRSTPLKEALKSGSISLNPGERTSLVFTEQVENVTFTTLSASTQIQLITVDGEQIPLPPQPIVNISDHLPLIRLSSVEVYNSHPSEASILSGTARISTEEENRSHDALIQIHGLTVRRPANNIDDLIPGLTLNIHQQNSKATLTISPAKNLAKDQIISFTGNYNLLIQKINILTRTDENVINEINFATPAGKTAAEKQLGKLQGSAELSRIKTQLQQIVTQIVTVEGIPRLLETMGVSTNQNRRFDVRNSALRGYLEIDEEKLDQSLATDFDMVAQIFGSDTDGDLIIDQGIAFQTHAFLQSVVQNSGSIDNRLKTLGDTITNTQESIDRYTEKLEDKESELRKQFAIMEQQIQALEKNSQALNQFMPRE